MTGKLADLDLISYASDVIRRIVRLRSEARRNYQESRADAAQVLLEAPADVSIRAALGDLDPIREAMERLETYQQLQASAFQRRSINTQLRQQIWTGAQES